MPGSLRNQSLQAHYAVGNNTLAGSGTFTDAIREVLPGFQKVRLSIFQDQAGSLTVEQSNDATFATGVRVYSTTAVVANTLGQTADLLLFRRYIRVKCTNSSGTPLTLQELDVTLIV